METKLKFKVGDKVRVKSREWYITNKYLSTNFPDRITKLGFVETMAPYCGKVLKITKIFNDSYRTDGNLYCWQDWMLEDEPVTEEKQEQLNKNDMETKEMTKEEVFVYLNNTKIMCTSKEETAKVQEKLFELGVEWMLEGKEVCEDKYLLFINEKQQLQHTSYIDYWIKNINRRIEPTEILAIKLKEDKPKFNPEDLKPFDKVLVRDNVGNIWRCNLFSNLNKVAGYDYQCVANCWNFCIPYNEETKHLVGTKEEAPNFYKTWEK